nr:opioid growth factor receptor-like [Equus asinus]
MKPEPPERRFREAHCPSTSPGTCGPLGRPGAVDRPCPARARTGAGLPAWALNSATRRRGPWGGEAGGEARHKEKSGRRGRRLRRPGPRPQVDARRLRGRSRAQAPQPEAPWPKPASPAAEGPARTSAVSRRAQRWSRAAEGANFGVLRGGPARQPPGKPEETALGRRAGAARPERARSPDRTPRAAGRVREASGLNPCPPGTTTVELLPRGQIWQRHRIGILLGRNERRTNCKVFMLMDHEVDHGEGENKGNRLLMDREKWKNQWTGQG